MITCDRRMQRGWHCLILNSLGRYDSLCLCCTTFFLSSFLSFLTNYFRAYYILLYRGHCISLFGSVRQVSFTIHLIFPSICVKTAWRGSDWALGCWVLGRLRLTISEFSTWLLLRSRFFFCTRNIKSLDCNWQLTFFLRTTRCLQSTRSFTGGLNFIFVLLGRLVRFDWDTSGPFRTFHVTDELW